MGAEREIGRGTVRGVGTGVGAGVMLERDDGRRSDRALAAARESLRDRELLGPTVLVVEDTPTERIALRHALETNGFEVAIANDGPAALEAAAERTFDVVLLDLGLPGLSGFEVCRRLRLWSNVRIVVLSASDAEADRVRSLELGADDFLSKPVSTTELVARLRAMLRRRELDRFKPGTLRSVGALSVDVGRHEVTLRGVRVAVTPSEFKILALLMKEPGRVFSRTEIVRELWQSDFVGDRRSCDVHVTNLRRKLEIDPANPQWIVTVRGVGYKLALDD